MTSGWLPSRGLLPLRLLAERTELRAGLSAAMRQRGSSPFPTAASF
jgi:hypothetical protein